MSDIPKIQVNERELWLLTYYGKLLPKWECKMWATLSNVLSDNEQLVEIYLIKKRKGCGEICISQCFRKLLEDNLHVFGHI